jgi:hypothetical protein
MHIHISNIYIIPEALTSSFQFMAFWYFQYNLKQSVNFLGGSSVFPYFIYSKIDLFHQRFNFPETRMHLSVENVSFNCQLFFFFDGTRVNSILSFIKYGILFLFPKDR